MGILVAGTRRMPCALGRSGCGINKREGDGKTPLGTFRMLGAFIRTDRMAVRQPGLPTRAITNTLGWCDAPDHPLYNQLVTLPFDASHEIMMRTDRLYDVVIVLDYNITRRMRNRGSAIFFHIAHPHYRPTEGCVAIAPDDMRWLLGRLSTNCQMVIG